MDSWRRIQLFEDHWDCNDYWSPSTFLGGNLYFLVRYSSNNGYFGEDCIISFDVNSEKFRKIRFPTVWSAGNLMIVKGCIHLNTAYMLNYRTDLWKMDGDGWIFVSDLSHVPHSFSHIDQISRNADQICESRNVYWFAILEDKSFFVKIDMELFTRMCINNSGSGPPLKSIYVES